MASPQLCSIADPDYMPSRVFVPKVVCSWFLVGGGYWRPRFEAGVGGIMYVVVTLVWLLFFKRVRNRVTAGLLANETSVYHKVRCNPSREDHYTT